jgi:hypothetical protein
MHDSESIGVRTFRRVLHKCVELGVVSSMNQFRQSVPVELGRWPAQNSMDWTLSVNQLPRRRKAHRGLQAFVGGECGALLSHGIDCGFLGDNGTFVRELLME